MKHWETHPAHVAGCYGCKLVSVRPNIAGLRLCNREGDVTFGRGTTAYVRDMYAKSRAAGKPDPEPATRAAAAFAPARGSVR